MPMQGTSAPAAQRDGPGDVLVQLSRLTKVYSTEEVDTFALAEVDLEIARGEYVAIAGPSGCGKSTLLAILGLLESATSGEYRLGGAPVTALSLSDRAAVRNSYIGFVFQAFNLIGDLTVEDNVELPLRYRGMAQDERRRRGRAALDRVQMSHRARHFPGQLSGGQQQRVAVARAVAGEPQVLLADEPTGNLDSVNGESVMQLLGELHRDGGTICMVTHDARFASHASRTIHLADGKIVAAAAGGVSPLAAHPAHA